MYVTFTDKTISKPLHSLCSDAKQTCQLRLTEQSIHHFNNVGFNFEFHPFPISLHPNLTIENGKTQWPNPHWSQPFYEFAFYLMPIIFNISVCKYRFCSKMITEGNVEVVTAQPRYVSMPTGRVPNYLWLIAYPLIDL